MRRQIISGLSVLFFAMALHAGQQSPPFSRENPAEAREEAHIRRERDKALNAKRQEELKRDTERLLKLATELKENVDKTNQNMLSLDVIKKAEEIEKLAKSVKDKMKAQGLEPMPGSEPPR